MGLIHRQFRSHLRTFRPTDAAFVLHLAGCERCRGVASRLLDLDGEALIPTGRSGGLDSAERDILLDLTRAGFLLSMADAPSSPQDDLPFSELQRFLEALSPEQRELIRHLLDCESCRKTAAKVLAPQDQQPQRSSAASLLSPATVLS